MPDATMKTIAVANTKGGVGKTTLTVNLAVAAERTGETVVIIDLDDNQTSVSSWGDLRQAETPAVVAIPPRRLPQALQAARGEGVTLAFIDTPARSENPALEAIKAADLVLMPCRRGFFDVDSLSSTANLLKLAGNKPGVVVLSAFRFGSTKIQADIMEAIAAYGLSAAPIVIHDRAAYINSIPAGLTAQEFEPNGPAAQEIAGLYAWVLETLKA